jgi:CheY-like chemotaxis protein
MKAIVLDNSDDDSEESVSITEPNKDIKILVAEDTPHNLDLLCNMLQSIQYTNIGTAINGAIAIDKIDEEYERKEPYDVIFLDLRMPIEDGFDVINHINEKRYNSPQISIITASVLESDRNKCKKLGVKYFMSKPYTIDQVRNTLVKMAHCI